MIWALIVWNAVLTVLVGYVIGGYLWHINETHKKPLRNSPEK